MYVQTTNGTAVTSEKKLEDGRVVKNFGFRFNI